MASAKRTVSRDWRRSHAARRRAGLRGLWFPKAQSRQAQGNKRSCLSHRDLRSACCLHTGDHASAATLSTQSQNNFRRTGRGVGLAAAYQIATTGRPGPVLVDVTKDAQQKSAPFIWPPKIDLPGYRPVTKAHGKQIVAGNLRTLWVYRPSGKMSTKQQLRMIAWALPRVVAQYQQFPKRRHYRLHEVGQPDLGTLRLDHFDLT